LLVLLAVFALALMCLSLHIEHMQLASLVSILFLDRVLFAFMCLMLFFLTLL
jgi:hypothetical protein